MMKPTAYEFSRRSFLQYAASGLATAGSIEAIGVRSVAQDKPKVIVGAHPWVYAATQPDYDITPVLDQIFSDMRYAGMDGIELMHTALRPADAVERISHLSQRHQLPIIGTSFDGKMWDRGQHQAVLEDAELILGRLAKLGGKTLGTSVGNPGKPKTEDQLDAQAELLKKILALCKKRGIVLNLHNHTYEVENNEHDLKGTLLRIPDIQLGPDLNWLIRAGVDPVSFIIRYGDRIVFLHLRDQKTDGSWPEAMGEGNTDFLAIGKALRAIRYSGPAVIELAHPSNFKLTRPLRESLRMSREFIRRVLRY